MSEDKKPLGILVVEPTLPVITSVMEVLKGNRKEPIHLVPNTQEALSRIAAEEQPCVLVFSIRQEEDFATGLQLVKSLMPYRGAVLFKILIVTRIENYKLKHAFQSMGVSEFLNEKTPARSVAFKVSFLLNQLVNQLAKQADDRVVRGGRAPGNNDKLTVTGGNVQVSSEILADDVWLIKGVAPKKVGVQWVIESEGPDPDSGNWEALGQSDDRQEQWIWRPETEGAGEKVSNDGWTFKGNKPAFDGETGRWKFVATKPNLSARKNGAITGSKIKFEDKEITLAADNPEAEARIAESRTLAEKVRARRQRELAAKAESEARKAADRGDAHADAAGAAEREAKEKAEARARKRLEAAARGEAYSEDDDAAEDDAKLSPEGRARKAAERAARAAGLSETEVAAKGAEAAQAERAKRAAEAEEAARLERDQSDVAKAKARAEREAKERTERETEDAAEQAQREARGEHTPAERAAREAKYAADIKIPRDPKSASAAEAAKTPEERARLENEERERQARAIANELATPEERAEREAAAAKVAKDDAARTKRALENAADKTAGTAEAEARAATSEAKAEKDKREREARAARERTAAETPEEKAEREREAAAATDPEKARAERERQAAAAKAAREVAPTVDVSNDQYHPKPNLVDSGLIGPDGAPSKNFAFKRVNGILRGIKKSLPLVRTPNVNFGSEKGVWEKVGDQGWIYMTPEMRSQGADYVLSMQPLFFLDRAPGVRAPMFDAHAWAWMFDPNGKPAEASTFPDLPAVYQNYLVDLCSIKRDLERTREEMGDKLQEMHRATWEQFERFEEVDEHAQPVRKISHLKFFLGLSDMIAAKRSREEILDAIVQYLKTSLDLSRVVVVQTSSSTANARATIVASTDAKLVVGATFVPEHASLEIVATQTTPQMFDVGEGEAVSTHPLTTKTPVEVRSGALILYFRTSERALLLSQATLVDQMSAQIARLLTPAI